MIEVPGTKVSSCRSRLDTTAPVVQLARLAARWGLMSSRPVPSMGRSTTWRTPFSAWILGGPRVSPGLAGPGTCTTTAMTTRVLTCSEKPTDLDPWPEALWVVVAGFWAATAATWSPGTVPAGTLTVNGTVRDWPGPSWRVLAPTESHDPVWVGVAPRPP